MLLAEKYQTCHLRATFNIPVHNLYYPEYSSMVHRYSTLNGRVFRHAPRELYLL